MNANDKIVITGGAGLVGQNLIVRLKQRGFNRLVAIHKHPANTATLRRLHPDITVIEADLAEPGEWEGAFAGASAVILSQAQIGSLSREHFDRNNVVASQRILDVVRSQRKTLLVVHISSSVVNSRAVDFYTETKGPGEAGVGERPAVHGAAPDTDVRMVRPQASRLARAVHPKGAHLQGPGPGRLPAQPLYVGDLCNMIIACLDDRFAGRTFDISGLEQMTYLDIVRQIKDVVGSRTVIVRVPFRLFWWLLRAYAVFDTDPPFTTRQLEALVIPESFPLIDWPAMFGCMPTSFPAAVEETFREPTYSRVFPRVLSKPRKRSP